MDEELTGHNFIYGRDYELTLVSKEELPMEWRQISRTYGALTQYRHWIYWVDFHLPRLHLSDSDIWISLAEMQDGYTQTGKKIVDAERLRLLEICISGGLKNIPVSINIDHTVDYLSHVEVKPKILGVGLPLTP